MNLAGTVNIESKGGDIIIIEDGDDSVAEAWAIQVQEAWRPGAAVAGLQPVHGHDDGVLQHHS